METKQQRLKRFNCSQCGKFADCPMLDNQLWKEIKGRGKLFCHDCAEKILGRPVGFADLADCPANQPIIKIFNQYVKKDPLGRALELRRIRGRFPFFQI